MKGRQKYSIKEFSKKMNISVRTLHYYDEIGLLTPEKHPDTGHRWYDERDMMKLQKIVGLKLLGYSLDQIKEMLQEERFDLSFKQSLLQQKAALEDKKEQIETALKAIQRTITLLEEEKEVDADVLASLIRSMQTEKEQREWLEQRVPKEMVEQLFNMPDKIMEDMDRMYVRLSKKVKALFGKPPEDPEVQNMIDEYMKATLRFVGDRALNSLSGLDLAETEGIVDMLPSPFSIDEEQWLNRAMEHYMRQNGLLDQSVQ